MCCELSIRSEDAADILRKQRDGQRLTEFISRHRPDFVCLGAASLSCISLRDEIHEAVSRTGLRVDMDVAFGDESLPRLYENSSVSSDQIPRQHGIVRRAVALGRFFLNPLAMVATLCGPGKEILSWKLCPFDHLLTPDEKLEMVEQILVDATNQVGLDINLAANHKWLFSPLQFISGLGPQKASSLQRAVVLAGSVLNRNEFLTNSIVGEKVYLNSVGFIRVRPTGAAAASIRSLYMLDDTRILPMSYSLAARMLVYAYDGHEEQAIAFWRVRAFPGMLMALDIDKFAEKYCQEPSNKKYLILLKMELLQGFRDWRFPFQGLSPEEELYLLSGETQDTLSEGRIVQVLVRVVRHDHLSCVLRSGLKGIISAEDFPAGGFDSKTIREGQMLACKVKRFDAWRFIVYLTIRGKGQNIEDPRGKGMAKKRFRRRMIEHSIFRNWTYHETTEYLLDKNPGVCIIRPSMKGPVNLILTIKMCDGVYAHKDIIELGKDHKDFVSMVYLGKKLHLDNKIYGNLDEVLFNYVYPIAVHLRNMHGHRKFKKGNENEVDEQLRAEKKDKPTEIVYCFGISHDRPGSLILAYIRNEILHRMYIGLRPKGFRFEERYFNDIDMMASYVKRNLV